METQRPDEQQIENWKAQHGGVYALEVDGRTAYVRKPLLADLTHAQRTSGGEPIKMHQTLLDNCWLSGPAEFKTDDGLCLSAVCAMGEVVAELMPTYKKQLAKYKTRKKR